MGFFETKRTLSRIDKMIDNAVEGKNITDSFDESKLSALEAKFANYLNANGTGKMRLQEEKDKINQYISDISHQTKTPMTNIMLYTQLLSESDLSQKDRKLLEAISSQTEKLNFLISSLVKTSRLESGIIAVNPQPESVDALISSALSQTEQRAAEKGISVKASPIDFTAVFDAKWTCEALCNIIDNAIKYTDVGGEINISATVYQLFCRIDIADNGIGIAEDELSKIFTRFYRSPAVSQDEGVGIGLFLVREILSKQGGYIKVKSQLGKGSTFSIFLPAE